MRSAQRQQQDTGGQGNAGQSLVSAGRSGSAPSGLLGLQRTIGNRAVAQMLARDPLAAKQPAGTRRKRSGFHGDGRRRRTDAGYAAAVGKADAARLDAAPNPMPADLRADINAKLSWFEGRARAAYAAAVKPALILATAPQIEMPPETVVRPLPPLRRNALERQVNDWFGLIQKLKVERVVAWEKNARIPEIKPSVDVVEIAIAIVALGIGGVAYGLIENMLSARTPHLLKEFITLAGLEAGDLAAEGAFHAAVKSARADIEIGIKTAASEASIEQSVKGALKKGNDPLSFFVEALRNHTLTEEAQQHINFNNASASLSDQDLAAKNAALKLIYDQLAGHPEEYLRELTVGFMRMIEEARLEERSKRYGGNRDLTFYSDRYWSELRAGEIALNPAGRQVPFVGKWSDPDLSFDGFEAVGGGINAQNFENLADSRVQDVALTTIFHFWAKNPYSGGWTHDTVDLIFKRDASGRIVVIDREDPREWLTSYYTGESRDHTDEERAKFAPRGAAKLYDAVKSKRVKKTRLVDLQEIAWDK